MRIAFVPVALLLSACSTTATLYPVQGPLSTAKPVVPLIATADGILGNRGNITLTIPPADKCKGQWASSAGIGYSVGTVNLFSRYGSASGLGVATTVRPGMNRGEAVLLCESGNIIEVEFYTGSGTANGFGLAKDKNDNVFRMIF